MFIVAGTAEPFQELQINVVPTSSGAGPLGGIYTALTASPRARTLIVACDLPYLSLPLLQRLAAPSDADLVIPRTERGYEPLVPHGPRPAPDRSGGGFRMER